MRSQVNYCDEWSFALGRVRVIERSGVHPELEDHEYESMVENGGFLDNNKLYTQQGTSRAEAQVSLQKLMIVRQNAPNLV